MKPTRSNVQAIHAIANRAFDLYKSLGIPISSERVFDTVLAVHCGPVPIKLTELLKADDSNFVHDIGGLLKHYDVVEDKLTDCFLPRYAA